MCLFLTVNERPRGVYYNIIAIIVRALDKNIDGKSKRSKVKSVLLLFYHGK